MSTVRHRMLAGLGAQVALLATLADTVGLGLAGGLAGLAYGAAAVGLLSRALERSGAAEVGPANLVTLARSVLVGGVAALVVDAFFGPGAVHALVALAVVALALDAVDGRVARSTRTVSAVGARFDMEVDSVLVLLLSVYVARSLGIWVLAIGSARYLYWIAGRAVPWLRAQAPPRHWCKVVAVVQAIVLILAAADVLPRVVAVIALLVVAGLLAESFGRGAWMLWPDHRAESGDGASRAMKSASG